MVLSRDALKETFSNLVDQLPVTFIWNGKKYTGTKGVLTQEAQYSDFGFSAGVKFSIICQKKDFPVMPKSGEFVTFEGIKYRIIPNETDSADVSFRLDIGDEFI